MCNIQELISNKEWHFNTAHASVLELEAFRIEEMAADMKVSFAHSFENLPLLCASISMFVITARYLPSEMAWINGEPCQLLCVFGVCSS